MRKRSEALAAIGLLGLFLGTGGATAWAHPLDPALLEMWERGGGRVDVLWRLPALQPIGAALQPQLPPGCTEISSHSVSATTQSIIQRWRLDCGPQSLVGRRIGVLGLRERRTDALVRVHLADGRLLQTVLRGDAPEFTLPQRSGYLDVMRSYLALGFDHILSGLDHLLFLLGLVLLVHGWRLLLETVTAFTLGHSVTLSLAALGIVHIPTRPVEALIAVTIFVVAVEVARDARGHTLGVGRVPWAMAFGFGLLHGLGFAGALAQVGLPDHEIPLALLSFNCGIELGQVVFIVLVLAAREMLRKLPASWLSAGEMIPAYAIGSLSAFWIFQRSAAIFLR